MTSTKPWYASAGVWGALVTLAGSVATILKVELDPRLLDDVAQWLLSLATLVGGAVALWGRVRAVRRIDGGPGDDGGDAGKRRVDAPRPGDTSRPSTIRVLRVLAVLAAPAACAAAGGCSAPAQSYVDADRATYDAIAPEYRAYVAGDPALSEAQRLRRERTVELWRLRVDSAVHDADPALPETAAPSL